MDQCGSTMWDRSTMFGKNKKKALCAVVHGELVSFPLCVLLLAYLKQRKKNYIRCNKDRGTTFGFICVELKVICSDEPVPHQSIRSSQTDNLEVEKSSDIILTYNFSVYAFKRIV